MAVGSNLTSAGESKRKVVLQFRFASLCQLWLGF